jgi:hypothetical protein
MRVRGDTGTGGSQILGFQIPGNRPAVMFSAISFFFLGMKTSRCRSKCGGRNCLWSFPWLAVCCYLTGHKECKHIFNGQGPDGYMQNVVYREEMLFVVVIL